MRDFSNTRMFDNGEQETSIASRHVLKVNRLPETIQCDDTLRFDSVT